MRAYHGQLDAAAYGGKPISQATLFLTMFCRVNGTGHSLVVKDGGYLPCMSSLTTRIERSVMARIVTVSDQICLTHDEN
jgi:hypothetical protein